MYGTIGCCKDVELPAQSAGEWLNQTRGKVKLPKGNNAHRD
jgi:hypothetical protein